MGRLGHLGHSGHLGHLAPGVCVTGVTHVTQFHGNGAGCRDRVTDVADTWPCEQCGDDDGQQRLLTVGHQLVSLHEQCVRFWQRKHGGRHER
jgi:hypothetical protein